MCWQQYSNTPRRWPQWATLVSSSQTIPFSADRALASAAGYRPLPCPLPRDRRVPDDSRRMPMSASPQCRPRAAWPRRRCLFLNEIHLWRLLRWRLNEELRVFPANCDLRRNERPPPSSFIFAQIFIRGHYKRFCEIFQIHRVRHLQR